MAQPAVLLVDDDNDALSSLARVLRAGSFEIELHEATTAAQARQIFETRNISVVVLDLSLDESTGVESGFQLLSHFLASDPAIRIIVLTGHGSEEFGIRSLNSGAANFLEKPANIEHLTALITDGIRQCQLQRRYYDLEHRASKDELQNLVIGNSSATEQLREQLRFAASTSQPVLLSGETGTGKGLCAYAMHRLSKRCDSPFVRCSPNFSTPDLVNSEIFGHTRGAFTGANKDREGLLAMARGGTFFLDEVDELPSDTQIALLGVLQDQRFRPIGSTTELPADIRLISATNREVDECVSEGHLRKDFFHRISHERILLPPLRERIEDIEALSEHFLRGLHQSEDTGVFRILPEAIELLCGYSWPGNIRELQAVVEGAAYRAAYSRATTIDPSHITLHGVSNSSKEFSGTLHQQVEQFKRSTVEKALKSHGGSQTKAADELGINRSTLRRILERT